MPSVFLDDLQRLTDLGESAVLSTVVVAVCGYFLYLRRYRDAVALATAYLAAAAAIAVLKIIFISCGHGVLDIRSTSGHTALSVGAFGMLGLLLARNSGVAGRAVAVLLGLLVAVIGISRIILHYHSGPEAVTGALVGLCAIAIGDWTGKKFITENKAKPIRLSVLMILLVVAIALTYGHSIPAERQVTGFAITLRGILPFCR